MCRMRCGAGLWLSLPPSIWAKLNVCMYDIVCMRLQHLRYLIPALLNRLALRRTWTVCSWVCGLLSLSVYNWTYSNRSRSRESAWRSTATAWILTQISTLYSQSRASSRSCHHYHRSICLSSKLNPHTDKPLLRVARRYLHRSLKDDVSKRRLCVTWFCFYRASAYWRAI